MEPLSIASSAAGISQSAWMIYKFINDTKNIDRTVQDLQTEVKQIGELLEFVKEQVKFISGHDGLLEVIKVQIDSCAIPIRTIEEKLSSSKKSNVFKRCFHQAKFSMNESEINRCRDQIQKHIQNLQLSLLIVTTQATYIAPQRADEDLVLLLNKIQEALDTQDQKIDDAIRYHAGICLSKGTSLYAESLGGSIMDVEVASSSNSVTTCLNQLLPTETVEKVDLNDPAITSDGSWTNDTNSSSDASCAASDLDDSLNIEVAQSALILGKEAFNQAKYEQAELSLRDSLKCIMALPKHKRSENHLEIIHLFLAVCAFHLHGTSTAEDTLIRTVGIEMKSTENIDLKFEATRCLVIIYTRMHKLELAISTCQNLYRNQRTLFGRDKRCYRTLALLAAICNLQGNSSRADAYWAMMPEDIRDRNCKEIEDLTLQQDALAASFKGRLLFLRQAITDVAWSCNNTILAVAYGRAVEIRNVNTGNLKHALTFPTRVCRIILDSRSENLAVCYENGSSGRDYLQVWSLDPFEKLQELSDKWSWENNGSVITDMRFSLIDPNLIIRRGDNRSECQWESFDLVTSKHEVNELSICTLYTGVFFTAHFVIRVYENGVFLSAEHENTLKADFAAQFKKPKAQVISAASSPSGNWMLMHYDSSIIGGSYEHIVHYTDPLVCKSEGMLKHACIIYDQEEMLISMMHTESGKIMLTAHDLESNITVEKVLEARNIGCTVVGFSPNGEYAFYTATSLTGQAELRVIDARKTLGLTSWLK